MQHQQIIHTQSQNTGPINFNETFADYELLEKKGKQTFISKGYFTQM